MSIGFGVSSKTKVIKNEISAILYAHNNDLKRNVTGLLLRFTKRRVGDIESDTPKK